MSYSHSKPNTLKLVSAVVIALAVLAYGLSAAAAPNYQINYQGKLLDSAGATVSDGNYSMVFRLYTVPTGGSHIWTETNSVAVTSGLFSVMLGSSTSLTGVNFDQTLYLGVNVAGDGEMLPRKILGTVPAAFQANNAGTVGNVASSSFLRSDQADTATGLLTLTGGATTTDIVISGTATTTNLVINSERFSDLTGTGLSIVAGALTADLGDSIDESELNIAGGPTNGYVLQASSTAAGGFAWVATSTFGFNDHDSVTLAGTPNYVSLSGQQLTLNRLDIADDLNTFTSSDLAGRLTNETGTGNVVFSAAPTFTGTTLFATASTSDLVVSGTATTTNFVINDELFTDLTGTGLQNTGGVLTLDDSGDWTGTFDGQEGTYYLDLTNATGQLASTSLAAEIVVASEIDSEAELEALLADVSNIFTNNDTIATSSLGADVLADGELNTEAKLEAFLTGVTNILTDNDSTTDLSEGSNLYWTDGRFDARLTATTSLPNITTLAGLTTVGTIGTGVWQGTAITDTYISDTLTVGVSGSVADGALSANVSLLGQQIDLGTSEVTGTLSIASTTLAAGTGLSFSGATLNLDNDFGASIDTGEITDDTIAEVDLDMTNTPTDEYCLTYESGAGGDFEWQSCSGGSINFTDLGDVDTTNVQNGNLIFYNGASWATTSTSSLNINTDDLVQGSTNLFSQWTLSGSDIYYNTGNVGIGITNPAATLSLGNTLGDKLALYDDGANVQFGLGIQTGELQIYTDSSGGDVVFGHGTSGALTETMRITGDGNVGIGTTSPQRLLHLVGEDGGVALPSGLGAKDALIVENNGNANIGLIGGTGSRTALKFYETGTTNQVGIIEFDNTTNTLGFNANSNATYDLTLTSGGNVGIGTTTPGYLNGVDYTGFVPLHVAGDQKYLAIDTTGDSGGIILNDASEAADSRIWSMDISQSGGALAFANWTDVGVRSPRMLISSSGNVGIGTTSPAYDLDVYGDARIDGRLVDSSGEAGTSGMVLQTTGSGFSWVATSTLGLGNPFGSAIDPTELASSDFGDFTCNGTSCSLDTNSVGDNEIDYSNVTLGDFTDDVGYLVDITGESFVDLTDTPSSYTAGSILFTSGSAVTEDNANFFWDDTNNRLGIGTSTPSQRLTVSVGTNEEFAVSTGASSFTYPSDATSPTHGFGLSRTNDGAFSSVFFGEGTDAQSLGIKARNNIHFYGNQTRNVTFTEGGNVGIGTTTPIGPLHIHGSDYNPITADRIQENANATNLYLRKARGSVGSLAAVQADDTIANFLASAYDGSAFDAISEISTVATAVSSGDIAGQMEFSTSDTSGAMATRMVIDSSGNVGIGTSTPQYLLDLYTENTLTSGSDFNLLNFVDVNPGANSLATVIGSRATVEVRSGNTYDHNQLIANAPRVFHYGTGNVTDMRGVNLVAANEGTGTVTVAEGARFMYRQSAAGTTTNARAGRFGIQNNDADGYIGTAYGNYITLANSGTIDNTYGVYVDDFTKGTQTNTPYSFYASDVGALNYFAGNTGIGTTSPASTLDVWGDFRVGTSGTPTLFTDVSDGYVGIGLSNPNQLLDVLGSEANDYVVHFQNNDADGWGQYIYVNNNDADKDAFHVQTAAGSVFVVENGGLVGIGTDAPAYSLDVAGDVRATGALYDNSASAGVSGMVLQTTGSGFSWVATSTLGLGNPFGSAIDPTELASSDFGDFTCNGTSCSLDTNSVGDNEIDYSNVTLGDFTDDVGYLVDITGESFVDLTDTPSSYTAGSILFTSGSAVTEDNANFFWDDTNNRLGIGTTSPAHTLSVSGGNIELGDNNSALIFNGNNASIQANGAGNLSLDSHLGFVVDIDYDNNNAAQQNFIVQHNGGTELFRIEDTGNVGIGTSTPATLLQVDGANGNLLRLSTSDNLSDTEVGIEFRQASAGNNFEAGRLVSKRVSNLNDFDLIFETGENAVHTEQMRLTWDGKLGIGTTSPQEELHIAAADPAVLFTNDTTGHSATDGLWVGYTNQAYIWNYEDTNLSFATNNATRMTIDNSGNVGIGTTSPNNAMLHLYGDAGRIRVEDTDGAALIVLTNKTNFVSDNRAGGVHFNGDDSAGTNTTYARINGYVTASTSAAEQAYLGFETMNAGTLSEAMRIDENGTVLIGTTSSATSLEVLRVDGGTGGAGLDDIVLLSASGDGAFSANGMAFTAGSVTGDTNIGVAGAGGTLTLTAGTGGSSSETGRSGDGGDIILTAGDSGGGSGSGGAADPGDVLITAGAIGNSGSYGQVVLSGGDSAPGLITVTGGDSAGGAVSIVGGSGASSGGTVSISGGNGSTEGNVILANSFGQVGISEGTPSGELHITEDDVGVISSLNNSQLILEDSGNTGFTMIAGDSSTSRIDFGDAGNASDGGIQFDNATGNLSFHTGNTTERLTIDSSGNVGIGTTTPAYKFEVVGSLGVRPGRFVSYDSGALPNYLILENAGGENANISSELIFRGDGVDQFTFGNDYNRNGGRDFFIWDAVAGANRLMIDSSGNVGIGTTTPDAGLVVSKAVNIGTSPIPANAVLAVTTGGTDALLFDTNQIETTNNNDLYLNHGGTGRLILANGGGNVGIGDTTPSAKLNVGTGNVSTVDGTDDLYVTDDIELDGDLYGAGNADFDGVVAIGDNATPNANRALYIDTTLSGDANNHGIYNLVDFDATITAGRNIYGNFNRLDLDGYTTGGNTLHAYGVSGEIQIDTGGDDVNNMRGLQGTIDNNSLTGTVANALGVETLIDNAANATITTSYGFRSNFQNSGQINTHYAFHVLDAVEGSQGDAYAFWTNESDVVLDGDGDGIAGGTHAGSDLFFGEGQDAAIWYDGSDLQIDPQIVGSGDLLIPNGNVGIGTTNPDSVLTVMSADPSLTPDAAADEFSIQGTGDTGMSIFAGVDDTASIYFGEQAFGTGRSRIVHDGSDESLAFYTAATQRLTVDASGNVGIGTTTPSAILHIYKSTGANVAIIESNDTQGTLKLFNSDPNPIVGEELGWINFKGVDSDGNETAFAQIRGRMATSTNGSESGYISFLTTQSGTTNVESMRIDENGYVAIGTTSPNYILHVEDDTNDTLVRFDSNHSSGADLAIGVFSSVDGVNTSNAAFYGEVSGGTDDYGVYLTGEDYNYFAGNIGIGDFVPSEAELVVGNAGAGNIYITLDTGGTTNNAVCWDNSGATLLYDCDSTPADYAESYPTESGITYGEIVMITDTQVTQTDGATVPRLAKADGSAPIIGITSDNYHDFTSAAKDLINPSDNPLPVALNGRVPVEVNLDGGVINQGDPIGLSTVAGVGAKATTSGWVVGTALESYDGTGTSTQVLVFVDNRYYYAPSELTVADNGNIGIGTTTPTAQLHTTGSVRFENFGAGTLTTDANGNVMVSSDERLKHLIGTYEPGLEAILAIEPVQYTWRAETGFDTEGVYTGFSAQNVELVLPEAVSYDKHGYRTLSERPILAAVVTAIKEVWESVTANEGRIDELEAENAALEARLEALEAAAGVVPPADDDEDDDDDTSGGGNSGGDPDPEPDPGDDTASSTDPTGGDTASSTDEGVTGETETTTETGETEAEPTEGTEEEVEEETTTEPEEETASEPEETVGETVEEPAAESGTDPETG